MPSYDAKVRALRSRWRKAARDASLCGRCGLPLAADDPVTRRRWGNFGIAPVCCGVLPDPGRCTTAAVRRLRPAGSAGLLAVLRQPKTDLLQRPLPGAVPGEAATRQAARRQAAGHLRRLQDELHAAPRRCEDLQRGVPAMAVSGSAVGSLTANKCLASVTFTTRLPRSAQGICPSSKASVAHRKARDSALAGRAVSLPSRFRPHPLRRLLLRSLASRWQCHAACASA